MSSQQLAPKASNEDGNDWLAALDRAADALTAASVAAEKAGEKWAMFECNKAWWLVNAIRTKFK